MRIPIDWLGFFVTVFLNANLVYANIGGVTEYPGGSIAPKMTKGVQMVEEKIVIDLRGVSSATDWSQPVATVRGLFVLENKTAAIVQTKVVFPILSEDSSNHTRRQTELRQVRIDGKETPFFEEKSIANTFLGIDSKGLLVYAWEMEWAPFQQIRVEVEYSTTGGIVQDIEQEPFRILHFNYVARTGALWEGPIVKAEFLVHLFTEVSPTFWGKPKSILWDFLPPKNVQRAGNTVSWRFTNWEPKEDFEIRTYLYLPLEQQETWNLVKIVNENDWCTEYPIPLDMASPVRPFLDLDYGYVAHKRVYSRKGMKCDLKSYMLLKQKFPFLEDDNRFFHWYRCQVMESQIHLRYGKPAESPLEKELASYFASHWYRPSSDYSESLMSETERKNLALLRECQAKYAPKPASQASQRKRKKSE